jgi:hypothetical protein
VAVPLGHRHDRAFAVRSGHGQIDELRIADGRRYSRPKRQDAPPFPQQLLAFTAIGIAARLPAAGKDDRR